MPRRGSACDDHRANRQPAPCSSPREGRGLGIAVVGAGFIVRDCHLPAYADAGFRVVGLTSRSVERARATAASAGIPKVYCTLDEMLDDPAVEIIDIAVPPLEQPAIIDRVIERGRNVRGILAQKPLAMSYAEASRAVASMLAGRDPAAGQSEHAVRPLGACPQIADRRPRAG